MRGAQWWGRRWRHAGRSMRRQLGSEERRLNTSSMQLVSKQFLQAPARLFQPPFEGLGAQAWPAAMTNPTVQQQQHPSEAQSVANAEGAVAPPAAPDAAPAAAAPVPPEQPWEDTSLQQLRAALQHFAAERQWEQFHTPRNLLLALVRIQLEAHADLCSSLLAQ